MGLIKLVVDFIIDALVLNLDPLNVALVILDTTVKVFQGNSNHEIFLLRPILILFLISHFVSVYRWILAIDHLLELNQGKDKD